MECDFGKLTKEKFKELFRGCSVTTKDGRRIPASRVQQKDIKYNGILKVINPTLNIQYVSGDPVGRILKRKHDAQNGITS
jgi:hypothetical protein